MWTAAHTLISSQNRLVITFVIITLLLLKLLQLLLLLLSSVVVALAKYQYHLLYQPLFWILINLYLYMLQIFDLFVMAKYTYLLILFSHLYSIFCVYGKATCSWSFAHSHFLCKTLNAVSTDYLIIFWDLFRIFFATYFKGRLQKIIYRRKLFKSIVI